jgi:hypothetical protein
MLDWPTDKFRRKGDDLWSSLLLNELPDLVRAVETNDAVSLAGFLKNFGRSYVWFGGIIACIDGYTPTHDEQLVALAYFDNLESFTEYLGIIRFENPESGPWGSNLEIEVDTLVDAVENELGLCISPPVGIINTDGIRPKRGPAHYRHINALYCAHRAYKLSKGRGAFCEYGAGPGLVVLYSHRMGTKDYTVFDPPITCLLAGHFLIEALGPEKVSLYAETAHQDSIKILPYWACENAPNDYFTVAINQDSIPEISDNLVRTYLDEISKTTNGHFLSINHECFAPKTLKNFVSERKDFCNVYRMKSWVREGYLEEVFCV